MGGDYIKEIKIDLYNSCFEIYADKEDLENIEALIYDNINGIAVDAYFAYLKVSGKYISLYLSLALLALNYRCILE